LTSNKEAESSYCTGVAHVRARPQVSK